MLHTHSKLHNMQIYKSNTDISAIFVAVTTECKQGAAFFTDETNCEQNKIIVITAEKGKIEGKETTN